MTAQVRLRLPNRRGHELLSFEHGAIHYTAGVGRFENGDLAEPTTAKHGTAVDLNARDAAVGLLLLQHGCSVDTLRWALTRNGDGSASGPLARTLDLLSVQGG
jgi:ribonucleoside-diphosphate reductase alpha chain